jgi:hypothetical protein
LHLVRDAVDLARSLGWGDASGPLLLVHASQEAGHRSADLGRAFHRQIGIWRGTDVIAQDMQTCLWQVHHHPSSPLGGSSSLAGDHQQP